jgi:hypothetical protein
MAQEAKASVMERRGDRIELLAIEGEQLGAVTFVQDYLQLDFDGPRLTLTIWPRVVQNGMTRRFEEAGYRDALCGLIGKIVREAYLVEGDRLQIEFLNGAALVVPLGPGDYQTAYGVVFEDNKSTRWGAW